MDTKISKTKVKVKFSIFLLCAVLITISLTMSLQAAFALRNPAAVYCEALGYDYVVESTEEGERGLCQLPNNQTVDAWAFLQGKAAQEYSYCQEMGYEIRTVIDGEKCSSIYTSECAVCVLEDETEVEVSELMGLTFWDAVCGDGICGFPEDSETCSEDCPPPFPWALVGGIIGGILAALLAGATIYLLIRRRRRAAA